MKPEAVRFGNLGFDRHLVAALIAPDLDGGGGFLRDGAFLDDDFDVGLVPRADLDAAVEGVQIEIRRAGRREMFGLALDVLSAVGADKIDTACRCQQSRESERSRHFHKSPGSGLWPQERVRRTDAALERKGREGRREILSYFASFATSAFDRD